MSDTSEDTSVSFLEADGEGDATMATPEDQTKKLESGFADVRKQVEEEERLKEMSQLRRLRGMRQARLTRRYGTIEAKIKKEEGMSKDEADQHRSKLREYWKEFQEAHETIVAAIEDEKVVEDEEKKYDNQEAIFDRCMAFLGKILAGEQTAEDKTMSQLSRAMESLEGVGRQKLPELQLPHFDGKDITAFHSFFQKFTSIVDNRKDITAAAKMTYLKSALREPAANCVVTLLDDSRGYEEAKRILQKRYGQKAPIKSLLVRKLIENQMETKTTADQRKLYDFLVNTSNKLEQLGIQIDSQVAADLLVPITEVKLPQWVQTKWEMEKNRKRRLHEESTDAADEEYTPTLQQLFEFFDDEITAKERVEFAKPPPKPENKKGEEKQKGSATSLIQKGQNKQQQQQQKQPQQQQQQQQQQMPQQPAVEKPCAYCNGLHGAAHNCELLQSLDVEGRWGMVTAKKGCFICMQPGHQTQKCFKKKDLKCDLAGCKGMHHKMLHKDKE